jgi:hypothetical protein
MAIGVIAAMFAMGTLSPKPVSAQLDGVDVTVTPATAKAATQVTILVTGTAGGNSITAIPVGGTITVTFGSKWTVPSTIAASNIKLKASVVSGGSGVADRLNNAADVTITGRAVTITVPDMDNDTGNGDQQIAASSATTGSVVTITFTQAAGIITPEKYQAADATGTSGLTVKSSTDDTAAANDSLTAITSFTKFTPTTATSGSTITVTGGGFNATCADCKIRLSPQNTTGSTGPTTGAGGVADNGSGSIDADGVFSGTVVLGTGTAGNNYVWITDKNGYSQVSATQFAQKASATPRSTTSKPGSTVSVDLVDYTTSGSATIALSDVTIRGTAVAAYGSGWDATATIAATGATTSLKPFQFKVPSDVGAGVHKVSITDSSAKVAVFDLTISLLGITVTPATAVPGQAITLSGTGYDKTSGTIAIGDLTMKAGTVTTTTTVNAAEITIDNTGYWSYTTIFPVTEETSGAGVSNTIVFTATDSASLVGKSDTSFSRTPKSVTLSPTTVNPGESLTVTIAGFTVDSDLTDATGAEFEVTLGTAATGTGIVLTGTSKFPIGADGTGVGTVTIPPGVTATTHYVKVADNAGVVGGATADNPNTKIVKITVPKGTVSVSPASASTGSSVTVTGTNFPPNTTASALTIGTPSAMPTSGILTDADGGFTVLVEVPAAASGGSLAPGTHIVTAKVGEITGSTTGFSAPNPTLTISPASASVEETITLTGVGFNSLGTATTLTIGSAVAMPSPAPRASRNGDITAEVLVPLLNAGAYTVTLTNGSGFSASTTFTATAAKVAAASTADTTESVFADVIANDDSLVRVWRFSNADQSWNFYDPRPAFASANTLVETGAGDIVWVNVTAEQTFQSGTLFPGWNLISLK